MVLFTKEYLPTSVLFFPIPNFQIMIAPTQVAWYLEVYPPSPSKPVSRCMPWQDITVLH